MLQLELHRSRRLAILETPFEVAWAQLAGLCIYQGICQRCYVRVPGSIVVEGTIILAYETDRLGGSRVIAFTSSHLCWSRQSRALLF